MKIFHIFLIAVLLAGCGPSAERMTATAVMAQALTQTAAPTFTPTLTPTITPIPTETPDPNKPFDATGRDPSTGEYIKTFEENGRMVSYVWKPIQFGKDLENGITGHWFESRMAKGPINLTGYGENGYSDWGNFTLNLNVYSIESFRDLDEIGYLYHPDEESDYVKNDLQHSTLASTIMFDLFLNYYDLLPENSSSYGMGRFEKLKDKYPDYNYFDDGKAFVSALNNGATIQVGDGLWEPHNGYNVYWIDEAMAMEDSSLHVSLQSYTTRNFYWKVIVNDGKLIAVIAPAQWLKTQLSWPKAKSREKTFRSLTLFLLQAIINGENPNEDISFLPFQHYGGMAGPDTSIRTNTKTVTITTSLIALTATP